MEDVVAMQVVTARTIPLQLPPVVISPHAHELDAFEKSWVESLPAEGLDCWFRILGYQ